MKRILLIGDDGDARYHPLPAISAALRSILPDAVWTETFDYPTLTAAQLLAYDLVINYADLWGMRDAAQAGQAFLDAFAQGLRMLVLHGGIIAHGDAALLPVYGATFTQHPPRTQLTYAPSANHPATSGLTPFSLFEEPYQFEMDDAVAIEPLLGYTYEGRVYPAGWSTAYGKGRMAYLQPGHDAQVFEEAAFRALVRRCAIWCMAE